MENIKFLKISTNDYIQSRHFPSNTPNKFEIPEKSANQHKIQPKIFPLESSNSHHKLEQVKRTGITVAIPDSNKLVVTKYQSSNNSNFNFDEDHNKLLEIKKNLENQIEDIRERSAKKLKENYDGNFEIHSNEKAKKSGVGNSQIDTRRLTDVERELAEALQKNQFLGKRLDELSLESSNKSLELNMKIRIIDDLEREKRELIVELNKFRNILAGMKDSKSTEGELSVKLQDSERKVRLLAEEIEKWKSFQKTNLSQIDEKKIYEEKIVSLSTEIQRLNSVVNFKQDKINELDSRIQLISFGPKDDIKRLEEKIRILSTENQGLNGTINFKQEKINELENKLLYKEDNKVYEEKIVMLSSEVQRLNTMLNYKQEKISELENNIHFLSSTPKLDTRSLDEKIVMLSTENQRLNSLLTIKLEKISDLESKIHMFSSAQDNFRMMEDKVALLSTENLRLIGKLRDFELNSNSNSNELVKLRSVINDITRQYDDLKSKYDRTERDFQMKIHELEEKYFEKERESTTNINILRSNEHELEDLRNDNRRLRVQIEDLQNNHSEVVSDLHSKFEHTKQSHIDAEKNKLSNEFQIEKESLIRELEGLRMQLSHMENDKKFFLDQIEELKRNLSHKQEEILEFERHRQIEIENIRVEIEEDQKRRLELLIRESTIKLHAEIENLEKQIKTYKNTIFELENKISLIIKENERISVAYDQKMKEIDVLNYRAQNLERIRAQDLEQMRIEFENRNAEAFELKIQELRYTFENEKSHLQIEIKEFQQKAIDYENKINFFTIEIERLNGIIIEKQEEAEEWRLKFEDNNVQFRKLKEAYLVSYADVKMNAEQAKVEAEIKYLQGKLKEYEAENSHLKKQLDDYKNFNNKRVLELGEWKERISSANSLFDRPEDLKKSYDEYMRLKKDFQEVLTQKKLDTDNYENKIRDLNIALDSKKMELSELTRLLNNEKEQRKKTQIQLENMKNEFSGQVNSKFSLSYSDANSDNLRLEINELKKQNSEMTSRMTSMRDDVIKKNEILSQRIMEMETAKRRFEEELKKFNEKNANSNNTEEYRVYSVTPRKY